MNRRPLIIPVFLPQAGCPHQCLFCNQRTITQSRTALPSPRQVAADIDRFIGYADPHRRIRQIAFYGGNFLGLPRQETAPLLELATRYVVRTNAEGIRFSTRPDTVSEAMLQHLRRYPVTDVELGVQSMDDRVLRRARRGHSAQDTVEAVGRLRGAGYRIGLQMMTGLPGDTDETALATAARIAALKPAYVRIYPTLVLRGSPLARHYRNGTYIPMALEPAVSLVARIYLLFRQHHVPVIRMGLQANAALTGSGELLAGPFHPAFGELVLSRLFLWQAIRGVSAIPPAAEEVVLSTHPNSVSHLRGVRNKNIEILQCLVNNGCLRFAPDSRLEKWDISVAGKSARHGPH